MLEKGILIWNFGIGDAKAYSFLNYLKNVT
jgi:hypothetical protein